MKIQKPITYLSLGLFLFFISCSSHKAIQDPSGLDAAGINIHAKHSGKHGRCSLCNASAQINSEKELTAQEKVNPADDKQIPELELSASLNSEPIIIPYINQNKSDTRKVEKSEISESRFAKKTVSIVSPAPGKKLERLGLIGFILGVLGLLSPSFSLGLWLVLFALLAGILSLVKFYQNPGEYKGKGFAIASLVIGIIGALILWFIVFLLGGRHR